MVSPRRLPSPELPAQVLTMSDLEAVLWPLTGLAPTESDLAAVGALLAPATPGGESSSGDAPGDIATRR